MFRKWKEERKRLPMKRGRDTTWKLDINTSVLRVFVTMSNARTDFNGEKE